MRCGAAAQVGSELLGRVLRRLVAEPARHHRRSRPLTMPLS
jgi:hypothetical protein